MSSVPSTDELRNGLLNAPEAPMQSENPGGDPPRRREGRIEGEIFDDCPVTPLGVRGDYAYYLDVLGQMRAIKKHDRETILSLFGHMNARLIHNFPQWRKAKDSDDMERKPRAFDQAAAAWEMYAAAAECGVFNPDNAVRGVGAWTDDDGNLIYHLGDKVLVDGKLERPGRIGRRIYPAQPVIPHPENSLQARDPVPDIQETLATWNWQVPDVHPHIALGMIATQMLCGALDWRPVFWLLAPAGSGKSELQKLIKYLHGDDGLVQTTDATKSGITSKLGQSSLPVAVDELEPGDERSTKERDIIALARVAASGGEWFRGSADQTGVGGKVYSAFFFSSILIPGVMKTQDVQRLIRLELQPLPSGTPKLNLQPKTWRSRGARLKQILIDRWPSWQERLAAWRGTLELAGVTGRDADNWGVVLAMADMALQEDIAADDVRSSWAEKIAFVAKADREDTLNDADAMLLHLMSQQFDPFRRGQQYNIAQWVMTAADLPGAPETLIASLSGDSDSMDPRPRREAAKKANNHLGSVGLRVYGREDSAQLFIMNKPIQPLKNLFQGSDWAGGVWKQSAARVPGAEATPNPPTVAGITSRGFKMPVKSIPGLVNFPLDRDKPNGPPPVDAEMDDFA